MNVEAVPVRTLDRIVCFFIKEPPTPQFTQKIELATLYTFDLGRKEIFVAQHVNKVNNN
jgi:hypothetical protein